MHFSINTRSSAINDMMPGNVYGRPNIRVEAEKLRNTQSSREIPDCVPGTYLVRTYGRACSIAFNSNGHESYICAKSSFVGNNLLLISKRRPTGKARYEQYWPSENRLSIINTR